MVDGGFKHIAVNPADERDEVILAGAVAEGGASAAAALAHAGMQEDEAHAEEQRASPVDKRAEDADEALRETGVDASESAPARKAQVSAKATRRAKDEYRTTTLDDLKGDSMPTAQKITIVAAVVCIIGAIAYYVAFML